jgi:tetratricopeptide (TPR) repeat protein
MTTADPPASATGPDPHGLPDQFGACVIHRELGAGAFGKVYDAYHTGLDRRVALKILKSPDSESLRRFEREAQIASGLNHPNLVKVLGHGTLENQPYLFMEFLDGESLEMVLRRDGALPQHRVVDIGIELARGLVCLHENGLLHRDLKPANIILTKSGEVTILDFGTCRSMLASSLTKTGQLVGTPLYMAPEVLSGELATTGGDLWALGCILYELLTGRLPFTDLSAERWFSSILTEPILPASVHDPKINRKLSQLLAELLERDKAVRLSSATPLLSRLQSLSRVVRSGASSSPVPAPARLSESSPQRRAIAIGGLSITILLAVILAITTLRAPAAGPISEYYRMTEAYGILGAIDRLRDRLGSVPGSARLEFQLGYALYNAGHMGDGLKFLAAASAHGRTGFEGALARGCELQYRGINLDEAAEAFRRAVNAAPNFVDAHLIFSAFLRNPILHPKEYEYEVRTALKLDPNSAWAESCHALLEADQGRWQEAITAARRACQLAPRLSLARTLLAGLLGRARRISEAEACWREAVAADGTDVSAMCSVATGLRGRGRYAEANEWLDRANKTDPGSMIPLKAQVGAAANRRDFVEATRRIEEVARREPSLAWPHLALAQLVLLPQGKDAEAERECQMAIRMQSPIGALLLAYCAEHQRQWKAAEAAYRMYFSLDPRNMSGYSTHIFDVLERLYGPDAMAEEYRRLARAYPRNVWIPLEYGAQRQNRREWKAAIAAYQDALAISPYSLDALDRLAMAHCAMGQPVAGESYWKRILMLSPGNTGYIAKLVTSLESRGQFDQAEALLRLLVANEPRWPENCLHLVNFLARRGRVAEANHELETVLRDPDHAAERTVQIAKTLKSLSRAADAERYFRRAIAAEPKLPLWHHNYCDFLLRQHRQREAEAEARTAMELDPTNADLVLKVVWQFEKHGDRKTAISILQPAFEHDRGNVQLVLQLARILETEGRARDALACLSRCESPILTRFERADVMKCSADLLFRQRSFGAAEKIYREYIALRPGDVHVRTLVASELHGRSRYKEAKEWLLPLMDGKPLPEPTAQLLVRIEYQLHGKEAALRINTLLKNAYPTSKAIEMMAFTLDADRTLRDGRPLDVRPSDSPSPRK